MIDILDTHYKMEDCRNKKVTAILRHLSTIRLQETSEHHLLQLPAQNRATSNQSPVRPTVQTVFQALHCPLIQPIQFGCQGIKGDVISMYSISSALPLPTQPVLSSLKAIRLVRHDLTLVNPGCLQSLFCPFCGQLAYRKFCSQSCQEYGEADQPVASSKLVFKYGSKVWGFFGLFVASSNGHDFLKLIKPSSVSTHKGISIHSSTFYAPPFCSWATEGRWSTLWTSQFTALVPDVCLSSYSSLLKFQAQLMPWIFFLLKVLWKAWERWRHWFLHCIAFLKWCWRELLTTSFSNTGWPGCKLLNQNNEWTAFYLKTGSFCIQ